MVTSTVRGPGRSTSRPAPHVRRRGAVYGIPTLAVDTDGIPIPGAAPVVGYIGQSRQTVGQREQQHRDCQPFADIIVGGSWTIEEGYWTDAELDAREKWFIQHGAVLVPGQAPQRPVYNYEHNLGNPGRVEVWRAAEQRQARDPGWQPPANGARVRRQRVQAALPVVQQSRRRFRWTRRRVTAAVLAAGWLGLFAAFWYAGWEVWHGWDGPRNSAIGASVVLAVVLAAGQRTARPKRRRWRGRRR